MYDPTSKKAVEFIDDTEIRQTIRFAEDNKDNAPLIDGIIRKAEQMNGLSHREATVLLLAGAEFNERIFALAKQIKQTIYGKRIVMFAPLYLSNYCVNGCIYCPYHLSNKQITRKRLTTEEIIREVNALTDMGHKRLAIEAGEDPVRNSIDYITDSIATIYSIKNKNGAIRRVNVNIAATTVENYKKLKDAGIGTYILFQETYAKFAYERLHVSGPKSNYAYHTEAHDRAMEAGIDDVGLGVLFGLDLYKYDFVGLLMHAEHLEAAFGVGPHTISVPRVRPAAGVDNEAFENAIPDDVFTKIVAVLRIAVPYTGMIVSTRESKETREQVIAYGVSQISGGSKTTVGGYFDKEEPNDTAQFEVNDNRTLDDVVYWLLSNGHVPSFCTACYREGRTGDRFMRLAKERQIGNICQPNSLITLKEYLTDYASEETKALGERLIAMELEQIPNDRTRDVTAAMIMDIENGERDKRF